MKTKSLIFAATFILSLALLSCVCASDVNETEIGDNKPFIEDNVVHEENNIVYEDEIAEVSSRSLDNEITPYEENPVADIVIDNKSDKTSFEIVNNIEYGEECDFDTESYEAPNYIGLFNDGQFFDMESDEKLDAVFNNIIHFFLC